MAYERNPRLPGPRGSMGFDDANGNTPMLGGPPSEAVASWDAMGALLRTYWHDGKQVFSPSVLLELAMVPLDRPNAVPDTIRDARRLVLAILDGAEALARGMAGPDWEKAMADLKVKTASWRMP